MAILGCQNSPFTYGLEAKESSFHCSLSEYFQLVVAGQDKVLARRTEPKTPPRKSGPTDAFSSKKLRAGPTD
jgi:hypothetical protein